MSEERHNLIGVITAIILTLTAADCCLANDLPLSGRSDDGAHVDTRKECIPKTQQLIEFLEMNPVTSLSDFERVTASAPYLYRITPYIFEYMPINHDKSFISRGDLSIGRTGTLLDGEIIFRIDLSKPCLVTSLHRQRQLGYYPILKMHGPDGPDDFSRDMIWGSIILKTNTNYAIDQIYTVVKPHR